MNLNNFNCIKCQSKINSINKACLCQLLSFKDNFIVQNMNLFNDKNSISYGYDFETHGLFYSFAFEEKINIVNYDKVKKQISSTIKEFKSSKEIIDFIYSKIETCKIFE